MRSSDSSSIEDQQPNNQSNDSSLNLSQNVRNDSQQQPQLPQIGPQTGGQHGNHLSNMQSDMLSRLSLPTVPPNNQNHSIPFPVFGGSRPVSTMSNLSVDQNHIQSNRLQQPVIPSFTHLSQPISYSPANHQLDYLLDRRTSMQSNMSFDHPYNHSVNQSMMYSPMGISGGLPFLPQSTPLTHPVTPALNTPMSSALPGNRLSFYPSSNQPTSGQEPVSQPIDQSLSAQNPNSYLHALIQQSITQSMIPVADQLAQRISLYQPTQLNELNPTNQSVNQSNTQSSRSPQNVNPLSIIDSINPSAIQPSNNMIPPATNLPRRAPNRPQSLSANRSVSQLNNQPLMQFEPMDDEVSQSDRSDKSKKRRVDKEEAAIKRKLKHRQIDASRRRREAVIAESLALLSGQRAESLQRDRLTTMEVAVSRYRTLTREATRLQGTVRTLAGMVRQAGMNVPEELGIGEEKNPDEDNDALVYLRLVTECFRNQSHPSPSRSPAFMSSTLPLLSAYLNTSRISAVNVAMKAALQWPYPDTLIVGLVWRPLWQVLHEAHIRLPLAVDGVTYPQLPPTSATHPTVIGLDTILTGNESDEPLIDQPPATVLAFMSLLKGETDMIDVLWMAGSNQNQRRTFVWLNRGWRHQPRSEIRLTAQLVLTNRQQEQQEQQAAEGAVPDDIKRE